MNCGTNVNCSSVSGEVFQVDLQQPWRNERRDPRQIPFIF